MRHNCPGEDCIYCESKITEREFGDPWQDDSGSDAAERDYERHLDRMGGE